ncbi:Uncharacterised protein [Mycobacteroides abscessus subsp. abscessus]|nr:Uncharacterised protein [Mycobacteroides abscessus subsp. abscessus]
MDDLTEPQRRDATVLVQLKDQIPRTGIVGRVHLKDMWRLAASNVVAHRGHVLLPLGVHREGDVTLVGVAVEETDPAGESIGLGHGGPHVVDGGAVGTGELDHVAISADAVPAAGYGCIRHPDSCIWWDVTSGSAVCRLDLSGLAALRLSRRVRYTSVFRASSADSAIGTREASAASPDPRSDNNFLTSSSGVGSSR